MESVDVIRASRLLATVVALAVSTAVASCGGSDGDPTDPGGGGGGQTPSISITLSSGSINVTAGQSGQVTVNVARAGGFTGAVTVTMDALTGVTVQPVTIAAGATSGTLTVQVAGTVAAGTLQGTVRGAGQGVQQVSANLSIVVAAAPAPDFTLSVTPATVNVQQGQNATVQVQIARTGGFTGAVTLAAAGLPTGVTAAFDPAAPTGNSSTLTLTAAAGAAIGNVNVTVNGTGQGVTGTKSATVAVGVTAPQQVGDYTLSLNPTSVQFQQGGNASTAVTINRTGGFTGSVALTATGLPQGVTATFDPASTTGTTSTLTLTASAGAATGAATVTVAGSATGIAARTAELGISVAQSGGGGSGNVAWAFCDYVGVPVWFAYRDGNGPWTRVVGDAQNVYRFQIDSPRGAVAYVQVDDGAPLTQVYFYTREEIIFVGQNQCDGVGGTKTVNGSVTTLGMLETAFVSMGSGFASVSGAQGTTFALNNVEDGPQDLVAARAALDISNPLSPSLAANRLIIRRGLNPPNNGTLAPLNFETEGFAPATGTVTVNGLAGSETAVLTGMFTTTRGSLGVYFVGTDRAATQTVYGVPADRLETGDLHFLQVSAAVLNPTPGQSPDTRQVGIGYRQVQNRTVALGPALSAPTVTSVGTAQNARLRAQWPLQSEYNRFVYFVASQQAIAEPRQISLGATDGFLQGAASADLEIPDLSGVDGWQGRWSLVAGASTHWTASGSGWQGTGFINFPELVDGTQFFSATRSGLIAP